jgi:hypothetical protein
MNPRSFFTAPTGWKLQALVSVFIFSLLVYWSSGYKNVVVWGSLAVLIGQAVKGRRRLHLGGLGPALGLLLAAVAAAAWFSIDRTFSFRAVVKFVELIAGYVVLVNVLPAGRRVERAADGWIWAMGMVAIRDVARIALAAAQGEPVLQAGRWFGSSLGYPTIAAGLYATAIVLAVARLPGGGSAARRYALVALIAAWGVLLYLLQTRSVLLGLAVGLVPVLLGAPAPLRWKAGAVAMAALAAMLVLLIPGKFRDRLLAGAWSDRQALWADARGLMEAGVEREPIRAWVGFGYGHTMFERLHKTLHRRQRKAERVYDHAHNAVVETRVQTGYVGLLAWMALLLTAGWRAVRRFPPAADPGRRAAAAGLAGALLCLLVYAQFSVIFALQPYLLLWSLLATLMAAVTPDAQPSTPAA